MKALIFLPVLALCQSDFFVQRVKELEADLATTENCDFWVGVFKLARGKLKGDFCEGELLRNALTVDEDVILGVVWIARNMYQVSPRLKGDLLARLTTMPFWLNQAMTPLVIRT